MCHLPGRRRDRNICTTEGQKPLKDSVASVIFRYHEAPENIMISDDTWYAHSSTKLNSHKQAIKHGHTHQANWLLRVSAWIGMRCPRLKVVAKKEAPRVALPAISQVNLLSQRPKGETYLITLSFTTFIYPCTFSRAQNETAGCHIHPRSKRALEPVFRVPAHTKWLKLEHLLAQLPAPRSDLPLERNFQSAPAALSFRGRSLGPPPSWAGANLMLSKRIKAPALDACAWGRVR